MRYIMHWYMCQYQWYMCIRYKSNFHFYNWFFRIEC